MPTNNELSSSKVETAKDNSSKFLIIKTILLTVFILFGSMVLVFVGFWYGQKKSSLIPSSSPGPIIVPSQAPTPNNEVPYGDENLDTDKEYQKAMNEVVDNNNQNFNTYRNEKYKFSFQYPKNFYVLAQTPEKIFVSNKPINIPEAYGGPLTPIEIIIKPSSSFNEAEEINNFKNLVTSLSYQINNLTTPHTGKWLTGTIKEDGYLGGTAIEKVLYSQSWGIVDFNYYDTGYISSSEFSQIVKSFNFY